MKQKTLTIAGLKYLFISFAILVIEEGFVLIFNLYPYLNNNYMIYATLVFLSTFSIVLFFWGVFTLWRGRSEIDKEHSEMVEKGLWLIIIFLAVSAYIGLFAGYNAHQISYFILNLMMLLVALFLLHKLVTRRIRNLIWIAIFLFILLDLLTMILPYITKFSSFYLSQINILTTFIPYTLIAFCYYASYRTIKNASE